MRSDDPRRPYFVSPERPTDYNRLHECRECRTMLVLGVSKRRWGFHVVTRCRCSIYSVETPAFDTRGQAEAKRRRMYAALPDDVQVAA